MSLRVNLASQTFFRNPAAEIEKMRAAGPVIEVHLPIIGKVWTTTTQDLSDRVLRDSDTFTIRKEDGAVAGFRWWMPGILRSLASSMLGTDDPDHRRLRNIVDEAFRRRAVVAMEPRILLLAGKLAEELFAEGSPADLVRRFARELPLSVICELLGLPLEDRPKFSAWAHRLTRASGPIGFLRMIPDLYAMKRYMAQRLDIAREQGGEGLIAELARVESEGGRISRDEMVSMLFLLLFAGHETTTHLISGSVRELLLSPDLRDWLREDWSRAEPATEEFLRFVSPVQFTKPRVVRRDMEFGGIALRKGDRIMPMLTAANLDPHANPRPEKLNLERKPNRHMAFGAGIHFCLGHQLARIEGRCALHSLFQRWPKLALAVDDSQIRWRTRIGMRAIEGLPVVAGDYKHFPVRRAPLSKQRRRGGMLVISRLRGSSASGAHR
jgi:cytochrome P450